MTIDLQELFDQAGRHAPATSLNGDLVVRRGRHIRARRRAVASAGAMLATGVMALGAVALAGTLPGAGPDPSTVTTAPVSAVLLPDGDDKAPQTSDDETPPPALADVTVPNPAPGFPVRRDEDWTGHMEDERGRSYWVNTYLLADRSGWNQVTLVVGYTPTAIVKPDGTIADHRVIAAPRVAGVTGHVTRFEEKGVPITTLYFNGGDMNVIVSGSNDVTIDNLVELGNSVTGVH